MFEMGGGGGGGVVLSKFHSEPDGLASCLHLYGCKVFIDERNLLTVPSFSGYVPSIIV